MTKNAEQLQALVAEFSADLAATVEAFTGQHFEFSSKIVENGSISIRLKQIEDRVGIIPLSWNGHVMLGLRPTFKCTWDSTHSFLAVENSSFAVHAQAKSNDEPLFRVEYDRNKTNRPSSHFHIHAHRDEVTHLLGLTKKLDSTKDQKIKKFTSEFPRLSKIHFPTGGHRFRPSLDGCLREPPPGVQPRYRSRQMEDAPKKVTLEMAKDPNSSHYTRLSSNGIRDTRE